MDKKVKKRLSIIKKDKRKYVVKGWHNPARPKHRRAKSRLHGNASVYSVAERTAKMMLQKGINTPPIKFKDPVKQAMFINCLKRSLYNYIVRS